MENIIINNRKVVTGLLPGNRLTASEVQSIKNLYFEITAQMAYISGELSGIAEEDLTTAEKNILRILES